MAGPPLVSALLPVHNRERWVAGAIESVLAQTYPHIELIVIDDGSTDGTSAVLKRFAPRLVVLSQPHRGPYAARNLGLRRATGELIGFIDSDDVWYPDRIERQLPLLDTPDVGLVFGDAIQVEHRGGVPSRRALTAFQITPPQRGWVTRHLAYGNFIPTSSVLVRRRCFEELGGFSEALPLSADYPMWFRISLRYRMDYVPRPVFEYAVHPGGISRDVMAGRRARIRLFAEMLGETNDRATRDELRRILFHLHLSLALACLRFDRRGTLGDLADGARGLRGPSRREHLRWSLEFAWNQLCVRLHRRWRTRGCRANRDGTRGSLT